MPGLNGCTEEDNPQLTTDDLLMFWSDRAGNDEIYVMDKKGMNVTRLTNNSTNDLNPQWSPDGSKIAFSSHMDGNSEIYVMNSDGNNQSRLTESSDVDESWPQWSPDGTKLMCS